MKRRIYGPPWSKHAGIIKFPEKCLQSNIRSGPCGNRLLADGFHMVLNECYINMPDLLEKYMKKINLCMSIHSHTLWFNSSCHCMSGHCLERSHSNVEIQFFLFVLLLVTVCLLFIRYVQLYNFELGTTLRRKVYVSYCSLLLKEGRSPSAVQIGTKNHIYHGTLCKKTVQ